MSKLLSGSICITDLLNAAKQGHKAFSRSTKNGKVYCNINVWLNDDKDQYGNIASMQVNFKDATNEDRFYIGNLKEFEANQPLSQNSSDISEDDDFPF